VTRRWRIQLLCVVLCLQQLPQQTLALLLRLLLLWCRCYRPAPEQFVIWRGAPRACERKADLSLRAVNTTTTTAASRALPARLHRKLAQRACHVRRTPLRLAIRAAGTTTAAADRKSVG
jgi:D-alanyl-D-alanine dipeptidase